MTMQNREKNPTTNSWPKPKEMLLETPAPCCPWQWLEYTLSATHFCDGSYTVGRAQQGGCKDRRSCVDTTTGEQKKTQPKFSSQRSLHPTVSVLCWCFFPTISNRVKWGGEAAMKGEGDVITEFAHLVKQIRSKRRSCTWVSCATCVVLDKH